MADLEVLWLSDADQIGQAAGVAARAMRDDLDWVAVADDPLVRSELLLGTFAGSLGGARVAGIRQGDRVLGVAAAVGPGRCVGTMLPPAARTLDVPPDDASDADRLLYFRSVLAAHDLDEPHWHVGPVGVEPGYQSRGMGRAVLRLLCGEFDGNGRVAWVKTVKAENVRFYEGAGFEVVEEASMLTAHLWFMRRDPR